MFTALASLLMNRPVRSDVAMTGEITLRGLVLPIGGLKEKTLAAKRAGIRQVVVPKRNEKDLPDIPQEVRDTLKFSFVENIDQVLEVALGAKVAPPRSVATTPQGKPRDLGGDKPEKQEKPDKPARGNGRPAQPVTPASVRRASAGRASR